jgi:hypothetical protein
MTCGGSPDACALALRGEFAFSRHLAASSSMTRENLNA